MAPFLNRVIPLFFILALGLLSVGIFFGLVGATEYVFPGSTRNFVSFEKTRPLHVSSAVFWILTAAAGGVLTFLTEHTGKSIRYPKMLKVQFILFALTFISILISYFFGIFGGREYWEFHPAFALPILIGWILFIINLVGSVRNFKNQPVYIWMWLTGALLFLFTYTESNLWLFSWFRNEIVHDMTIQWKSYGALVGAWNQLIYGSSIYLMDKIAGNTKYSRSKIAFSLYFLGLFNAMFNWGHHIYTLPTFDFVKHIAYIVSMTELILFARIIYLWRDSLSSIKKHYNQLPYKFIMSADFWVFIILGTATAMSVPALNIYMHGTHAIVAHTMGATIGINSMLLLAFVYDFSSKYINFNRFGKTIHTGYWLIQICLILFFLSLTWAGVEKGMWQLSAEQTPYGTMINSLRPQFIIFGITGVGLATGLYMVIFPALTGLWKAYNNLNKKS